MTTSFEDLRARVQEEADRVGLVPLDEETVINTGTMSFSFRCTFLSAHGTARARVALTYSPGLQVNDFLPNQNVPLCDVTTEFEVVPRVAVLQWNELDALLRRWSAVIGSGDAVSLPFKIVGMRGSSGLVISELCVRDSRTLGVEDSFDQLDLTFLASIRDALDQLERDAAAD